VEPTLQELETELATLKSRGEELTKKSQFTAEETLELKSVSARLKEVHEAITANQSTEQLRSSLGAQLKSVSDWEASVPSSNRPAHVFEVKSNRGGYTPQPQMMFGSNIANKNYQPVQMNEDDYISLKADGYSDSLISGHATRAYRQEFKNYMKSGGRQLEEMTQKAMTESGYGGILVPIEWAQLITNPPMRTMLAGQVQNLTTTVLTQRFPRIKTGTGANVKFPAYPVAVSWGGEQPTLTEQGSNLTTDNVDISVREVWAYGDFSISLLEDNAYGISNYIPQIFTDTMAVDLDQKIISGTGDSGTQPWGFTESGVVPTQAATTTGVGAAVTADDLINLMNKLPQQFRANGVWLFNSNTFAAISKLKDSSGRYIFLPPFGQATGTPLGGSDWWSGTILGRPYIISENMPDIAQTAVSIYFGWYERAYIMLNRTGPTVRVLDQPKFTVGNYQYALRARKGGRVVQPNAICGLKHN
jgi:HK97 family phage major capsid protein